ncbi:MAG: hypothetical protein JNM19_02595 [Chitinophagaceae bacterium]|nr:hypothetical protein [Chitinophagaceae bacterium]
MNSSIKLVIASVFSTILFTSCGGNADSSKKPVKAAVVDKPTFDIGIDTASLTTAEAVLDANRKIKEAAATFQRATYDNPGNKSDYYAYLKLKGVVSKKTAELIKKMSGTERADFLEKVKAIRD